MNPKRLKELFEALDELRDMARLEHDLAAEIPARRVWREVESWADGMAKKHKLNLEE